MITSRCRTRRTKGATTKTVGKAIAQDDSQEVNQFVKKPDTNPVARNVATPEISKDMKQESKSPKTICSNWRGMKGRIF